MVRGRRETGNRNPRKKQDPTPKDQMLRPLPSRCPSKDSCGETRLALYMGEHGCAGNNQQGLGLIGLRADKVQGLGGFQCRWV